ncbi:hypothetical protein [Thauera humireducens]|uniref:hypothetical protein n=1 Tax=Thauera humireducens TaxID=1134435 RepID=UPI00311E1B51
MAVIATDFCWAWTGAAIAKASAIAPNRTLRDLMKGIQDSSAAISARKVGQASPRRGGARLRSVPGINDLGDCGGPEVERCAGERGEIRKPALPR